MGLFLEMDQHQPEGRKGKESADVEFFSHMITAPISFPVTLDRQLQVTNKYDVEERQNGSEADPITPPSTSNTHNLVPGLFLLRLPPSVARSRASMRRLRDSLCCPV